MSTDTIKLGKLIDTPQGRDAIHIAISPMIAGQALEPGQHVFVQDGQAFAAKVNGGIGIVDPFLTDRVHKLQQFYLLLYPNTITSMRHEWVHPAFPEPDMPAESVLNALRKLGGTESDAWLPEFASVLIDAIRNVKALSGSHWYRSS